MYRYLIDFYPAGRKETAANTQSIKQSINRPINLHFLTTMIKKLAGRFSSSFNCSNNAVIIIFNSQFCGYKDVIR
jgi:hypothetical protein